MFVRTRTPSLLGSEMGGCDDPHPLAPRAARRAVLQVSCGEEVVSAYYNEFDKNAAAWLRELIRRGLIAPGDVDERSIVDVRPDDLAGYRQCHFFAGIGGWSYALRIAGWPDDRPVWTGSCPCQPFSSAARGRNKRTSSGRHLWPEWFRIIRARRPQVVFGEQVAQADDWVAEVADDLESEGYEVGLADIPAGAVGADHIRQRIWMVGYTNRYCEPRLPVDAKAPWLPRRGSEPRGVVPANGVSGRMARMRAFGNAIVPQVAAEFIAAFIDVRSAA